MKRLNQSLAFIAAVAPQLLNGTPLYDGEAPRMPVMKAPSAYGKQGHRSLAERKQRRRARRQRAMR